MNDEENTIKDYPFKIYFIWEVNNYIGTILVLLSHNLRRYKP